MSAASTTVGEHSRPTRTRFVASLIAMLLVCACSPAMPTARVPAASRIDPTPAVAGRPPASSGPSPTRSADDRDNGSTISLRRGEKLVLSLGDDAVGGTYWQIAAPRPAGVVRGGPVSVHPRIQPDQVAGSGVGTVTQEFTAAVDGTTSISARRTTCGEALRCHQQQATFTITIVVKH